MSKKRKKRNTSLKYEKIREPENVGANSIDYEKLAEAILLAHEKIKDVEIKKEEERKEKERIRWRKVIHQKECPVGSNLLVKLLYETGNFIGILGTLLFFKKKDAKEPRITINLLRITWVAFFAICEWVLYVFTIVFFLNISENMMALAWCMGTFLVARLLRIAGFEIENMEDKSQLISIISTIASVIALIIGIIALIV